MEWAVAYSATILCIAWVVPKIYAIAVQAAYIEAAAKQQTEQIATGTPPFPFEDGGYS